ncbi:MFS general substrate transporter [Penicillium sp. IBT 31633x]|nr:MFS general substrate transporter [Penicillium sp. IBT 31633x]
MVYINKLLLTTLFSSLYIALAYGILYLFFQSYPIFFQVLYGLSQGISGLAYIPCKEVPACPGEKLTGLWISVMIGSCLGFLTSLIYDFFHKRAVKARKSSTAQEEYRRLPLAMIGAPL